MMPHLYLSRKRGTMANQTDERKMHVRLDSELHRLVRIRCAELDMTIQDYVVRLLEDALRLPAEDKTAATQNRDEHHGPGSRRPASGRHR